MSEEVLYLCDRKKCENCSYPDCTRTTDISHAKNFKHDLEVWYEKDDDDYGIFKSLTDSMYQLYMSLRDSGFTDSQAFEMAKQYCSVAFADQAIKNYYHYNHPRTNKAEALKRLRESISRIKEEKNND